jgi:outer membrane protein assembly factor BamB
MGPESPNTRLLLEFDEPGLSGCLVSADGTVYINRHTSDAMSIIAIKPNGSHKEIVQSRGVGGLGAIGPGGTLYIMLWEENKGAILVLDAEGTELWRRSLPLCPYKLTWSKNILIGADGTIYASCGDRGNEASSLTVFSPDGTERWSLQDVHSYLAVAEDGTVYSVMEEGKVCAYDGQGEKKWEYDGCNDWSRYYDRVNYSIAIGPDGTVFILPNMLGIQDAPASRLIALTPTLKKAWHVDIPVNINSEYEAVYGPAIAPDGSLYILEGNNLFKISPDGKLELFAEGDFCPKGPIVDAAGIVYVSESTYANGEQLKDTSQVIALNPDGSEKWCTAPLDFEIWLDAVGADGNFFIWPDAIGADGTIYARGEYWVNGQGVFQPIITIGES